MPFYRCFSVIVFVFVGIPVLFGTTAAQTKKKKTTPKPPASASVETKTDTAAAASPQPEPAVKRNSRPGEGQIASADSAAIQAQTKGKPDPAYFYEFTQPEFVTNRITIEHDDNGKGTISFTRRGSSEVITDPIQISAVVLGRMKASFTALNFHDSSEDYQFSKDFSHLGNIKIALTKGGRERLAKFNYTQNKNAKVLADEYRKIANQAMWIFDVTVARENQPLDGPSQMDVFDGLLRRGEISDPQQMLSLLRELSDDERLPLIARNHATRLVQQIEKAKK